MDRIEQEMSAQCLMCKHYLVGQTCTAFNERIPDEIFSGMYDHRKPYKGDHGINFELIEGFEEENANAFKLWTEEEDELIFEEKNNGKSLKEIAEQLNRTTESVKSRLRNLRQKMIKELQVIDHEMDDILIGSEDVEDRYKWFRIVNLVDQELSEKHIDFTLKSIQNKVKLIIEGLNEREMYIISNRYLVYEIKETFEQLAQQIGISRQRVKQIESQAVRKMKTNYLKYEIRNYLLEKHNNTKNKK